MDKIENNEKMTPEFDLLKKQKNQNKNSFDKEFGGSTELLTNINSAMNIGQSIIDIAKIGIMKIGSVLKRPNPNLESIVADKLTNSEIKQISKIKNLSEDKKEELKSKLVNNKDFEKRIKENSKIITVIDIKADNNLKVGYNNKREVVISNSKKDNLDVWRKPKSKEFNVMVAKIINPSEIKISNDLDKFKNKVNVDYLKKDVNLVLDRIKQSNPEIQANFQKVNNQNLNNSNELKGYITLDTPRGGDKNFKILQSNTKEIHIQSVFDTNKAPIILNVQYEKEALFQKNNILVSNLDKNTVLGYDKGESKLTIGKLGTDGDIKWSKLREGLNDIKSSSPGKAEKLESLIKSGNYILNNTIKSIQGTNGVKVKIGQDNNGVLKYSTNGKNWKAASKDNTKDFKAIMDKSQEKDVSRTLKRVI